MGVGNKRTITKTRRKTRDVDQIKADLLSSKHLAQFTSSKAPEDLPGLGRHYCIECAKWFDTEATLVKQLREEPDPDPRTVPGAKLQPGSENQSQTGLNDASEGMELAV
ncbi:hypothetical protein UVI_02003730 [Ustilaginoidea virens]|uniref:Zinc finger double-stranded RNA binding domain-containing protein n=1 Tax=Ustilaginoidea virens TaxID=1159556 RepID=A0A1B5KSP3_USTVR|nr:hypothetical protein UVI_02003730 [Ustilaginoidea virens]